MYLRLRQRAVYAVTVTDEERGRNIARRMDRLGIPVSDLAERVGLDRESVQRARRGRARNATFGKIEAWLDGIEEEVGPDPAPYMVTTIVLGDGTKVTFEGGSPEDVAAAAADFLDRRQV